MSRLNRPFRLALLRARHLACSKKPTQRMKLFRQHLSARGKSAKVCLIAVARKLVTLANTLIIQDRLWQPVAPNNA